MALICGSIKVGSQLIKSGHSGSAAVEFPDACVQRAAAVSRLNGETVLKDLCEVARRERGKLMNVRWEGSMLLIRS